MFISINNSYLYKLETYVFTTSKGNTGIQERHPAKAPHIRGERKTPDTESI
jgi:hypothetical protein